MNATFFVGFMLGFLWCLFLDYMHDRRKHEL